MCSLRKPRREEHAMNGDPLKTSWEEAAMCNLSLIHEDALALSVTNDHLAS